MNIFSGLEKIVEKNYPLGKSTWFGLGGNADFLIQPQNTDQLADVGADGFLRGTLFQWHDLSSRIGDVYGLARPRRDNKTIAENLTCACNTHSCGDNA